MEIEFCRIAARMDQLGLLDMRVRVSFAGIEDTGISDRYPWSGGASLARVCAAVAHLSALRGLPPPSAYSANLPQSLEVYGLAGRLGRVDLAGAFNYLAAPTVDLAMSWLVATDRCEIPELVVRNGWPASLWTELYDLPTVKPGPDLARFYLARWLPAWNTIRSRRRRDGALTDQDRRIALHAWRIAGKRILGTELPDPSTFVHLAAS